MGLVQISPIIQVNNGGAASGSFSSLPVAGNAVFVVISAFHDPSHANMVVTDNQGVGNSYTKQKEFLDNKNQADIFADFQIGNTSGTFTVTITPNYGSQNYITAFLVEWSGLNLTSTLDQSATGTANGPSDGTTTAGPTGTTAVADELVMCVLSGETDAAWGVTTPSGYTAIGVEQDGNSKAAHQSAYKVVSATGTQTAAWTHDTGSNTGGVLATFRLASAASAVPVIEDQSRQRRA